MVLVLYIPKGECVVSSMFFKVSAGFGLLLGCSGVVSVGFPMVSAGFRLLLGCSGVVSVGLSNGFRWFPASARMQWRGFRVFFQWFPLVSGFGSDPMTWFLWFFLIASFTPWTFSANHYCPSWRGLFWASILGAQKSWV